MSNDPQVERPRILLVDDEEALVWSVTNRVVKARPDYEVVPMTDARAALKERIKDDAPDSSLRGAELVYDPM